MTTARQAIREIRQVSFATTNLIVGTTTATDGTLTYAGITRLKAGEGYFDPGGPSPFRWGDYFGGSVAGTSVISFSGYPR